MYLWIKHLHQLVALLSLGGFGLRLVWAVGQDPRLRHRLTRTIPHVNDSLLLGAGIWLALQSGADPLQGWLAAKLAGLVVYIILGSVALRFSRTPAGQIMAGVAAIAVFAWIASVAMLKQPLGFFSLLF